MEGEFDQGFFDYVYWEREESQNEEPYPDELWDEEFRMMEEEVI